MGGYTFLFPRRTRNGFIHVYGCSCDHQEGVWIRRDKGTALRSGKGCLADGRNELEQSVLLEGRGHGIGGGRDPDDTGRQLKFYFYRYARVPVW